eukprot:287596-Amphidinium_carterae.1
MAGAMVLGAVLKLSQGCLGVQLTLSQNKKRLASKDNDANELRLTAILIVEDGKHRTPRHNFEFPPLAMRMAKAAPAGTQLLSLLERT